MLNEKDFVLLAGDPSEWDAEVRNTILQMRQHDRGQRSAALVKTLRFGWTVCHASNFNRAVIFGGKDADREVPQEEAVAVGVAWANEDLESERTTVMTVQWPSYVIDQLTEGLNESRELDPSGIEPTYPEAPTLVFGVAVKGLPWKLFATRRSRAHPIHGVLMWIGIAQVQGCVPHATEGT